MNCSEDLRKVFERVAAEKEAEQMIDCYEEETKRKIAQREENLGE